MTEKSEQIDETKTNEQNDCTKTSQKNEKTYESTATVVGLSLSPSIPPSTYLQTYASTTPTTNKDGKSPFDSNAPD